MANPFDFLRKAANKAAENAHAKITEFDRQIAEIDNKKLEMHTKSAMARGSLNRAANFPVKNGADYLCPLCWVDEGKMSPLRPVPSQDRHDIFRCGLCRYEAVI